jgi:hypothetical protein
LDEHRKLKPEIQTKRFKKKGKYQGTLTKTGLRDGIGIFYFDSTKDVYFGEWKDDVFDGSGTYLYESGDAYRGQLEGGQKHGEGVYYYANGNVYDGHWDQDYKHGFGKKTYANSGESYQGKAYLSLYGQE